MEIAEALFKQAGCPSWRSTDSINYQGTKEMQLLLLL